MARRFLLALCFLAAALCALPATAPAKKRKGKTPKITLVSPMRVKVGKRVAIRGRNFSPRKRRNTVWFRSPSGRVAFAKPSRASRRKLIVTVPPGAESLLSGSGKKATRFKLRVTSKKASKYTSKRRSPILISSAGTGKGDCDGDGVPDNRDSDDDNDLLPDSVELSLPSPLGVCTADSDGDGMQDGWEYWSAKDLNHKAVPYPRKRPYPNPLDGSDGSIDFDGDSLRAIEEFRAWRHTGRSFDSSRAGGLDRESPLGYSDGTQTSRPHEIPATPKWQSGKYGIPFSPPAYPQRLDLDGNGEWSDDERDADADGMTNWQETHGTGKTGWWAAKLEQEDVGDWAEEDGQYWGEFIQRPFADLDPVDPDVDGDTLLDGEDDQDFDDWTNIDEMYNRQVNIGGSMYWTNAFNPCAPNQSSRTCERYKPLK